MEHGALAKFSLLPSVFSVLQFDDLGIIFAIIFQLDFGLVQEVCGSNFSQLISCHDSFFNGFPQFSQANPRIVS